MAKFIKIGLGLFAYCGGLFLLFIWLGWVADFEGHEAAALMVLFFAVAGLCFGLYEYLIPDRFKFQANAILGGTFGGVVIGIIVALLVYWFIAIPLVLLARFLLETIGPSIGWDVSFDVRLSETPGSLYFHVFMAAGVVVGWLHAAAKIKEYQKERRTAPNADNTTPPGS